MHNDWLAAHESALVSIRRDLHAHPELAFGENRTSGIVAHLLESWGYKVHAGLAGTGVVGTLKRGTSRRAIGIRADMDGLPIQETTGLPYASATPRVMHACGHDGHTAMLLGAAWQLAENAEFSGTVHLIFQPAEEDIGGATRMIEEGLFRKFPCDMVFALHNMPGLPIGRFQFRSGPIMAAVDVAKVVVEGKGGHGGLPHLTADPVVAAGAIVMALQTIVARNINPVEEAVITVGALHSGDFATVVPAFAELDIAVRSCSAATRDLLEARLRNLVVQQALSFGCTAKIDYERGYPCTVNASTACALAREVAVDWVGGEHVEDLAKPYMLSEDFAFMLEARPGSYFFMGNGPSRSLHDSGYDFSDQAIVPGAGYWTALVTRYLRA